MLNVKLIHYTGKNSNDKMYAAKLLAYTKNTRLQMTPAGLEDFMKRDTAAIEEELLYMSNTIPSSWEFVDLIFSISNVSRACAQQITRTRTASFAMQSQRVTDMSGVTYYIPESVIDKEEYAAMASYEVLNYANAIKAGESLEDARGLLPMNVHCNLLAKYNLRSVVDLLRARDSLRVQGEYQQVARMMKSEILNVWPWAAAFFVPKDKKAIDIIEQVARIIDNKVIKMQLAKAADLLKK